MASDTPDPEMMPLRIAHSEQIAEGIHLFDLRHPDGSDLPEFTSGAHLTLRVPNGLLRKYSLCNDPAEHDRYVIGVRREAEGRGGSVSLIEDSKIGDEILVAPPRNDFKLVKSAAGYIFIAGGIGITPIMSMIRHLKSTGGGRFKLYYLTRTPEMTAFREELSGPEFRGQVTIHHDHGDPEQAFDLWPVLEQPKGQQVYCCGPRALMEAVKDMTGHWSSSAVHFEAFNEPPRATAEDKPFKVRLARSGDVVEVPVGTTILEALRAHGIQVPSSCESGTCDTCRTKLLEGEADHRDLVLAEHEKDDNIMVCVSRARSEELVIDR
jgi:phthalate 4,5-dioxygenase reductase component